MKTTLDALQNETLVEEKISLEKLLSGIEGIALHDVLAKAKGSIKDEDSEEEEEEGEEDDLENDFDEDDFNEDEIEDWDKIEEIDPDDLEKEAEEDDFEDDDLDVDAEDDGGWDDNF